MIHYIKHLAAIILMALLGILPLRADIVPQTTDPTNSDTYKGWVDNSDGNLSGATITGTVWSGSGADLPQARFVYINAANFPDDGFRNFFKGAQHENYYSGSTRETFIDELSDYVFRTPSFVYNRNVAEGAADNIFTEAELKSITGIVVEKDNPYSYEVSNREIDVENLAGIEFFTEITHLSLNYLGEQLPQFSDNILSLGIGKCTNLLDFDPSVFPNLQWLDMGWNGGSERITSIDLSHNHALIGVRILSFTNLIEVNLSGLSTIEQIQIARNPLLEDLDLSDNVGLKRLGLGLNNLLSLDLSKNTELEMLACGRNQITDLDLSNNKKLYCVYTNDNQLTELDASQLTQLGSVPARPGKYEISYANQRRKLQAETFEITTGQGASAETNRYYYFRLDSTLTQATERPIVDRMTSTSYNSQQSRFVPARATWLTGATVINGTHAQRAPAEVDPQHVDGKILLLEPTSITDGVASGTVTYTYDVDYNGTGTDPKHVFTLLWTADATGVVTSVVTLPDDFRHGEVVSTSYYRPDGKLSDQPFEGVNIVVTHYSDGSTTTRKVIR